MTPGAKRFSAVNNVRVSSTVDQQKGLGSSLGQGRFTRRGEQREMPAELHCGSFEYVIES